MKVVLALIDGMRPDAIQNIPFADSLMKTGSYTMNARTVMPSVTLPCHMSLFHSVEPTRHGVTTNVYMPPARPIRGLCEVLHDNWKRCAFFYTWEELRDVARPGSLKYSLCSNCLQHHTRVAEEVTVESFRQYMPEHTPDFAFLYNHMPDGAGHGHGWMSEEYMTAVREAWDMVERAVSCLPEDYTIIVTADHGGHDRVHGNDSPEDMTIPLFCKGPAFTPGKNLGNVSILDIAPTIAQLIGVPPDPEWEGKTLV